MQRFIALAKAQPSQKLKLVREAAARLYPSGGQADRALPGRTSCTCPGAGAVLADLMGNQVQALITAVPALSHIRSGKLRALMTGAQRNALLPGDVPSARKRASGGGHRLLGRAQRGVRPARHPTSSARPSMQPWRNPNQEEFAEMGLTVWWAARPSRRRSSCTARSSAGRSHQTGRHQAR